MMKGMNYFCGALLILISLSISSAVESAATASAPEYDHAVAPSKDESNGSFPSEEFPPLPPFFPFPVAKRWAVLVAGSSDYGNYRHQADVCHAYQLLKKGGLVDEHIIVFMYDDIAFNINNPRPGIIINKPYGPDVYEGVPKDYTGDDCNAQNLFAVLVGNESALTGGSGKVVDSSPNDHIFIYYTGHGSPGILGMPKEVIYADDLVNVLKKKHAANTFERMVIYVEACEAGSLFDGLLPNNLNVYAVTASNPNESSWSVYCPEWYPVVPSEYTTCLGDFFSVAWLEDSDKHGSSSETLEQQYRVVKRRTGFSDEEFGSHVMRYGDLKIARDRLSMYIGYIPSEQNNRTSKYSVPSNSNLVNQRDADLLHYHLKYQKAPKGSQERLEAKKQMVKELSTRKHVDQSIKLIGNYLFGPQDGPEVLARVRPAGQPVVDDWSCFKMMVGTYEEHCGSLSSYGLKYVRAMANMCNANIVTIQEMSEASAQVCVGMTKKKDKFTRF